MDAPEEPIAASQTVHQLRRQARRVYGQATLAALALTALGLLMPL